jgi:hypothetical protein
MQASLLLRLGAADRAFWICGTTDIVLNNDLLQLCSRSIVLKEYSQINNTIKGLVVIYHHAVFNCTSL